MRVPVTTISSTTGGCACDGAGVWASPGTVRPAPTIEPTKCANSHRRVFVAMTPPEASLHFSDERLRNGACVFERKNIREPMRSRKNVTFRTTVVTSGLFGVVKRRRRAGRARFGLRAPGALRADVLERRGRDCTGRQDETCDCLRLSVADLEPPCRRGNRKCAGA